MRLCLVKGRKALFHCWEQVSEVVAPSELRNGPQGGTLRYTVAIVEYEDGSVESVYPNDVIFQDSKKLMARTEKEIDKWRTRQESDN